MVPLTDAYALRGVARYGLKYGPLRLWGSAAFVVGALVCGLLVDVIAARHLIWVIAAMAGLGALVSLGLRPLDNPKAAPATPHRAGALLRDPGFLAIIFAAALIQGSHAAYYTFASITWQGAGLGGLTIAGLWVLGVLAEIVVFALSPRFTFSPARAGGDRRARRGRALADHGAGAFGRRAGGGPAGAWADLWHHPGRHHGTAGASSCRSRSMARGQGYSRRAAASSTSSASILSGAVYARHGQGVYYLMAAMALSGAVVMWLARRRLSEPRPADHPQRAASGG